MSERDWAGVRERRAFEQAEREKQLLTEDQAEYDKYVQVIEAEQTRTPKAYRFEPIPFDQWRSYTDPTVADPIVRGGAASNKALLVKVRQDEANEAEVERNAAREACRKGQPDPGWKIPASAAGLKMTLEQGRAYVREQGELFVEHNPDYYPCSSNVNNIREYLIAQNISIPNEEVLKAAWLRLRELGLIEERPAPEPAPELTPIEEPPSETPGDYLIESVDPETGEPRKFTQREIWRMDSATYRKAFRVWGNNRPKFTRGYYS
jgi:hypothetical protein